MFIRQFSCCVQVECNWICKRGLTDSTNNQTLESTPKLYSKKLRGRKQIKDNIKVC